MSSVARTNGIDISGDRTVDAAQQTAARLVGFLYLFTNATAMFAFYVRGRLVVLSDAAQTARNIAGSERLFRTAIVTELITVAAVIMLTAALYTVLRPINQPLAVVAAFWRLAENVVLAMVTLYEFIILRVVSGAGYLRAFDAQQLQGLARAFLGVYFDGFRIGFVFLGLGSALFSYLWFQSRYIPRWFAIWGIFASLLMAIMESTIMMFPALGARVGMIYMGPMGVYEFGLGFWLLFKGIQAQRGGEV